jgi:hypothetical protein
MAFKITYANWSGTMQMVLEGDTHGVFDITFLPMIDLNPRDLNCIFSTLMLFSKEASRHNQTTIITFDQPLYWKAVMMTSSEECSNIVVRLGTFHADMSFLGSIGRIMSGSGLREMLELIYAPNAVTHMLIGKAVSRAVRAMMLLDTALQCMLNDHISGLKSKVIVRKQTLFYTKQMSYTVVYARKAFLFNKLLMILFSLHWRSTFKIKRMKSSNLEHQNYGCYLLRWLPF